MNLSNKLLDTKRRLLLSGLFLAGTVIAASSSHAASVQYTTTVAQFERGLNFDGSLVTGLSKFDPNLGTLTAINISTLGDYSVFFDIYGEPDDEEQAHSIDASISYQGSISLNKLGTFTGLFAAIEAYSVDLICSGEEFDGACTEDLELSDTGTYAGTTDTDTAPLLDKLILNGFEDQFIGSGTIADGAIEIGLFVFFDSIQIYSQENFTLFDLEGEFTLGPTQVTIEYEFTPAVVPVPAAAWLFGAALGLLGVVRRKN